VIEHLLRRCRSGALAPWCLWGLGLITAFYPALRSGFERLQIERGDPRLIQYLVEHSWRFVQRRPLHASLWDPPSFHPVSGAGAYTDTLLGAVAPYGLFRLLGCAPGPAFQLWMMTCLSLAFLATYLLLTRGLGLGRWPSAAGAFLTGFGISRVTNFNSPQLFTLFWGLFALYALARALAEASDPESTRAPRFIAAAAGLLVLQVWSAFYPAFFFALVLAMATSIALCLPECRATLLRLVTRHPAACAVAAIGAAIAVLPMARAHLSVIDEVGWRNWRDVEDNLPPLWSWIFPGVRNRLYGWLGVRGSFDLSSAPSQLSNGLGFVTTVASGLGLWLSRRRPIARLVLLTTAAVVVLVTVWPGGVSPWRLVWELVPGAQAIRYPARIGMLLTITGSIGLALLLDRAQGSRSRAAMAGLAVICLAEQPQHLRAQPEVGYRAAVQRIAAGIDPGCEAFYLSRRAEPATENDDETPRGRRQKEKWTQLAAMWASIEAGVPTVNGYAGNLPRGWAPLESAGHRGEGRAELDRRLARWAEQRGIRGRLCHLDEPPQRMPWFVAGRDR
jgi:hypothetical protein